MNIAVDFASKGLGDELIHALFVNCVSALNVVKMYPNSSFVGQKQDVYHADIDGLRAALLVKCVKILRKQRSFRISLTNIAALAETAARGSLYVSLGSSQGATQNVVLRKSVFERISNLGCRKYLTQLIDSSNVSNFMPIELKGEVLNRFG